MGCRIALIGKRFYKTRDCKKLAESRHGQTASSSCADASLNGELRAVAL
jgi:hypothetical protein